jgi:hypothetical protein
MLHVIRMREADKILIDHKDIDSYIAITRYGLERDK